MQHVLVCPPPEIFDNFSNASNQPNRLPSPPLLGATSAQQTRISVSSQEEQIKADEEFARQLQSSFSNTQNLELTFEDVNQMSEEALIELVLGESSTRTFGDVGEQNPDIIDMHNTQNQSSTSDRRRPRSIPTPVISTGNTNPSGPPSRRSASVPTLLGLRSMRHGRSANSSSRRRSHRRRNGSRISIPQPSLEQLLEHQDTILRHDQERLRSMGSRGTSYRRKLNGASVTEITRLPKFTYKFSDKHTGTSKSCTVCMEDYCDGDSLRTLPCLHQFHANCIDEWLGYKSTCPVCKASIK